MLILALIAALAVVSTAFSVLGLRRDGYHRVPTDRTRLP
jgi:hypothetical protein